MQLSTRQARVFRLAMLLGPGTPVESQKIISQLNCSEPTLTRALKELRETYSAEIRYSKATHSYQLVEPGLLDKKTLRQIHNTLSSNVETKTDEVVSKVSLDKEKRKRYRYHCACRYYVKLINSPCKLKPRVAILSSCWSTARLLSWQQHYIGVNQNTRYPKTTLIAA